MAFDERESNDGMKTVQQMMNLNDADAKSRSATDECSEVEIQIPTENAGDMMEDNRSVDANVGQFNRSNKRVPAERLSLMVKN